MSQLIFLSSSHPPFLIEQHRLVSETYQQNANIEEGRGGDSEKERT